MLRKSLQFLTGYGIMARFYYNKNAELADSEMRHAMQHFPREHMIIATVVAFLTAIPALLWPSEPIAAARDTVAVVQPQLGGDSPAIPSPESSEVPSLVTRDIDIPSMQPTAAGPEDSTIEEATPAWEIPVAKMMGVAVDHPEKHQESSVSGADTSKQRGVQTKTAEAEKDVVLRAEDFALKPRLRPSTVKPTASKTTSPKQVASKAVVAKPLKVTQEPQPDFFADDAGSAEKASRNASLAALKLTLPGSAKSAEREQEKWEQHTVRKGDSLWKIFDRMSLNDKALSEVMQSGSVARTLNRIRPGDQLELIRTSDGGVEKLRYMRNQLEGVVVTRNSGRLKAEKLLKVAEVIPTYAAGSISDSLFVDAKKAGLEDNLIMQLVNVFGWDIDFALDIRRGDSFGILYEQKILDGKPIGVGKILAAHFTNRNRTFNAVHYTDSSGHSGYYSPDGRSMRKAFLRTPVDFARVSSHFNLRRKHPVLHTIRAHKGVDYAASRGTPIRASGDGKITHRGRKGGYGRTVIIDHGRGYRTLYAHLNGYKRGQKKGSRVKQGQIIGYVGSSGLATGPHLHYEFHVNGKHKNPLTVAFPKAKPIPERERRKFLAHATEMSSQLSAMRTTRRIALREPGN